MSALRWHPADVSSEVAVTPLCREVTTSAWWDVLNRLRYPQRNQCNNMRSHRLELNNVSKPTPALYMDSSTGCGFFSSWPCVTTPNVHLDVWDCVESYAIHMILAHRLRITFTFKLKLIISFLVSPEILFISTLQVLISFCLEAACSLLCILFSRLTWGLSAQTSHLWMCFLFGWIAPLGCIHYPLEFALPVCQQWIEYSSWSLPHKAV